MIKLYFNLTQSISNFTIAEVHEGSDISTFSPTLVIFCIFIIAILVGKLHFSEG